MHESRLWKQSMLTDLRPCLNTEGKLFIQHARFFRLLATSCFSRDIITILTELEFFYFENLKIKL